jgi:hypothetical protein
MISSRRARGLIRVPLVHSTGRDGLQQEGSEHPVSE